MKDNEKSKVGITKKTIKRRVTYRGIGADADTLGCNRVHLWKVLTGRRVSKSLMARYNELKSC